ncbi:hypothetical protein CSAL01_05166 [Colletotrichum salicis]|uniref:Uncharacterized protein n=1 Tax=Colletotrichum salicis TaxID=1209931 RepID=A0A135V771_9PEZI|nr:hypothetical protein CSAL01_05166 [Colletotrichum salicis]
MLNAIGQRVGNTVGGNLTFSVGLWSRIVRLRWALVPWGFFATRRPALVSIHAGCSRRLPAARHSLPEAPEYRQDAPLINRYKFCFGRPSPDSSHLSSSLLSFAKKTSQTLPCAWCVSVLHTDTSYNKSTSKVHTYHRPFGDLQPTRYILVQLKYGTRDFRLAGHGDFVFCLFKAYLASARAEAGKTFKKIALTAQVAPITDNLLILPLASVVTRTQDPVSPSLLRHLSPGTHPILRHVVASETRGPSGTLNLARLERGWKQSRTPSPPYLVCVISRLQARHPMAWMDQRRLSSRRMRGRKPSSSLGGLPLGSWFKSELIQPTSQFKAPLLQNIYGSWEMK